MCASVALNPKLETLQTLINLDVRLVRSKPETRNPINPKLVLMCASFGSHIHD